MKPFLFSFLIVGASVGSLLAQGQFRYGNSFPGSLQAPVFAPDPSDPFTSRQGNATTGMPAGTQTYGGAPLSGSGFTVAIFSRPIGGQFREIHRQDFTGGADAGYWSDYTATDAQIPPGGTAEVIVRVWDNQGGAITDWGQATSAPTVAKGESGILTMGPMGGTTEYGQTFPPPITTGLRSFSLAFSGGLFISAQPDDVVVPSGGTARFSVEVTSTLGGPTFQWQREGVDIPGATGSTLELSKVDYVDAGGYTVVVSAAGFTATSRPARMSLQPRIASIDKFYIPEWGASAIQLSYDSTPQRAVRVESRSSMREPWSNVGQFINSTVRGSFFDISPTNSARFYRLSIAH